MESNMVVKSSIIHSGAKGFIIHRDVKSSNMLLDEKMVAKALDFGLSKMVMTNMSKTHISTMVKGSFGPALLHTVETRQISLAEWAKSCHGDGTLDQIIDPNVKGQIEVECLNKFVEIAISCLHDKAVERPLHCSFIKRALEVRVKMGLPLSMTAATKPVVLSKVMLPMKPNNIYICDNLL
ncbi:receptor-like protein kinase FERONIA [Pyrus ussuriensis x Pyrus communis]|uniref:Receptor-like protein kinase FERONIA n=1 Tax=Pyrus ussuriensis x Pyrus communis TaxID=2448454 RepID=A0A5N5I2W8_9ROSA|nr:receptor-like protein kinase FERONIA [Pyrus ussuriensis x Pyrus communis]